MSLNDAVQKVHDFHSLIELFRNELGWDIDPDYEFDELTFDWNKDELNLSDNTAWQLRDGVIRQLREFAPNQPWGIFFVEFSKEKIYRLSLRQILRALVPKQRVERPEQPTWWHENLLFICATKDYKQFTFAHFRGDRPARAILSTFSWQRGDTHIRTLCEYNLPALKMPADTLDKEAWLTQWRKAFDIEKVTDKFFEEYKQCFKDVEKEVKTFITNDEQARLYTQRLFNRLMFIYFIQKKGWLKFNGSENYLRELFNTAEANKENFLRDRLEWLFFWGLSNVGESVETHELEQLRELRGDVPYLNGGLFDREDEYDQRGAVKIPNDVFAEILNLFERYNFTVEESTPLDVHVAVDPEMLGKVFEELVTGRHESGSYYTPRQIVSFMCREALKHYVQSYAFRRDERENLTPEGVTLNEAIAKFVDEEDASELKDPEKVLEALKTVKVCDPACGSGAYLLGMMQELMRLRGALFKSNKLDNKTLYERKRSIIENNLYGVDKDKFAVQIACLRLWLSLAIEADEPQPLPNLDFKIGCADSLIAPAPSQDEMQMSFARTTLINDYRKAKGEFMRCHDSGLKGKWKKEVERLRDEISLALKHKTVVDESQLQTEQDRLKLLEQNLTAARNSSIKEQLEKQIDKTKRSIEKLKQDFSKEDYGFDWVVEFAEVFMPETKETWRIDDRHPLINDFKLQPTLVEQTQKEESGGFDIVLANPPYVRQELLGREYKEKKLKPVFANVYSGVADLYVYFYARTMQLLKRSGVGAFISSNKWLRAGYGEKLRQELLDKQAFHLIVDFGELPVFKAATFPAIFVWQEQPRVNTPTYWALVKDLNECYSDGIREHTCQISQKLPAHQFGIDKPRLASSTAVLTRDLMVSSGQRLNDYVNGQILYGIKTGLNEAFVISKEIKDSLIAENISSSKIIKPLLVGDDVRRYELHFRETYLIFSRRGINIEEYPSILRHLDRFRVDLTPKKSSLDKRGRKPGAYEWYELQDAVDYYEAFDKPKIIYPQIMLQSRSVRHNDCSSFENKKCLPTKQTN